MSPRFSPVMGANFLSEAFSGFRDFRGLLVRFVCDTFSSYILDNSGWSRKFEWKNCHIKPCLHTKKDAKKPRSFIKNHLVVT